MNCCHFSAMDGLDRKLATTNTTNDTATPMKVGSNHESRGGVSFGNTTKCHNTDAATPTRDESSAPNAVALFQ